MVVFKEFATSTEKYLVIVDHEGDAMENGTKLLTHDAMHGNYIGDWPSHDFAHVDEWSSEVQLDEDVAAYSLKSLIHTEKPRTTSFQTLGSRIISGEAHWGSTLKLNGEFGFIQNYWEWLEDILGRNKDGLRDALLYEALYASLFTYDRNPNIIRAFCEAWCPETNTLHTLVGEVSLSLWDLQKLGGLPIVGSIYEEVIPCAAELTGVDKDNYRFIPHSCEYLFAAFHHLQHEESDKSGILATHWIDFWFRGKSRYSKPKPRRLRKASRPQSTQNPDGEIGQPGKLSTQSKSAFKTIGVKSHHI